MMSYDYDRLSERNIQAKKGKKKAPKKKESNTSINSGIRIGRN